MLARATDLLRRHPHLGVRDAVHASTALRAGVRLFLGADRVFDALDELHRVDLAEPGVPWLRPGV